MISFPVGNLLTGRPLGNRDDLAGVGGRKVTSGPSLRGALGHVETRFAL